MLIRSKIRKIINNNDKLCALENVIRNRNDSGLIKLINGYYKPHGEYTSLIINHKGTKCPEQIIYYITYWWEDEYSTANVGFCAALRRLLELLNFSDHFHFTPVIFWGNTATYYDHGMDAVTDNAFEYYFEPVSDIDYHMIKECRNVIRVGRNGRFFISDQETYLVPQDEIKLLADVYKKHIHLNEKTRDYIENSINKILKHEKVLGVHVRGTDFKLGFRIHPVFVDPHEYLAKTKELLEKGKYDRVFLATDDLDILKMFQNEIPSAKLIYYEDVLRTVGKIGPHNVGSARTLHHYKLGLEVLRDVYTLANCDSLVCGLSQVAFSVQYVNLAIGRKYNEVIVIDHGVNKESSPEAIKYLKKRRRENKHDLHKNP